MRPKIGMALLIVALMVVAVAPSLVLAQAPSVSLEEQLKAQYTLVKMGADSNGAAVVEQGTVLVIKKGGILGVPYADQPIATHYQDGAVHSPNALMLGARGGLMGKFGKQQTTQFFQVSSKVYPSKVSVNLPKDQVTIEIVDCDSCNNVNPTTFYKADVVFQFPKGSLATMNPSQVEDAISGLLAIDDSAQDQGNNGQQGGNDQQGGGNQGGGGGGGGQAQQQAPPAEPQQIEKGQTPDQVKAALGNPDKIVNLGTKQIYVYKDLKVTFLNGKVTDVQ
jgi:uncharacterized membrane protein YgcG